MASDVSSEDRKYRAINKKITEDINVRIRDNLGYDFKLWLPRKNKGDKKISDSWGVFKSKSSGVFYEFDYYIKTDYETKITTLNFVVYNAKPSSSEELYNLVGELEGYNKCEYGYKKHCSASFDSDDSDLTEKVYDAVKSEIIAVLQNKLM